MTRSRRPDTNPLQVPSFETSSQRSPEEASYRLGHSLLAVSEITHVNNVAACGSLVICPLGCALRPQAPPRPPRHVSTLHYYPCGEMTPRNVRI